MQQEGSEHPVLGHLNEETSKPLNTEQVFLRLESVDIVFTTKRLTDANRTSVLSVNSRTTLRPLIEMRDESGNIVCAVCVCVCLHTLRKLDKKLA